MTKFYFKVFTSNQGTHAYCVEAPNKATADASIAAYSGALRWKPIEAEGIHDVNPSA
jgi:hypothetical protein